MILVGYFSSVLDPVAVALPGCLKSVAAVSVAIQECEGIVMVHTLPVFVPHSFEILLIKTRTQHLTNSRLTKYEQIILTAENISIKRCTVLNPAKLLPISDNKEDGDEDFEHCCIDVTELCTKQTSYKRNSN